MYIFGPTVKVRKYLLKFFSRVIVILVVLGKKLTLTITMQVRKV